MADVRVVDEKLEVYKTDLLVVGCFAGKLPSYAQVIDDKLGGVCSQLLKEKSFEGDFQQFRLIPTNGKIGAKYVLLLGLGKESELSLEVLRKAAGVSTKIAKDFCGIFNYATSLHLVELKNVSKDLAAQVVAEGSVLGAYQYVKYKTVEVQKIKKIRSVQLLGASESAVKKGVTLAESACLVRSWVNEPASVLHPKELASHAKDLEKVGVTVTVYDKKGIEELGLKALLAVNRGSVHEPRFVVMEYAGGSKKKVALVGKGITFDSGGLDLKTDEGMLTMKCDMTGAAVVIATVRAAALLKLPVHVLGVFAATENMPGGDAYKPGDIVETFSGKTIEIANTDAEGRVILSDALAYTERVLKPDAIIDLATLTGACVVALGSVCAGVMGTSDQLVEQLCAAGTVTHERVWKLPFFREYHDQVKSDVADLRNLGILRREAGAITAATFLSAFVEKTPWAHVDIAGTSWSEQETEYLKKGGTGFGVRLLINFLENWK